jgi:hypothetical protein
MCEIAASLKSGSLIEPLKKMGKEINLPAPFTLKLLTPAIL